jgi:thymidine kinase
MIPQFPVLGFNIDFKYICGRDNYTCQNQDCQRDLSPDQVYFQKFDPDGEDIETNICVTCRSCALLAVDDRNLREPLLQVRGRLIAITGPMYSQKSSTMKSLYNKYFAFKKDSFRTQGLKCLWVKPTVDDRLRGYTETHDGDVIEAYTVDAARPDLRLADLLLYDVVAIDEVQFFSERLIYLVHQLLKKGCLILINGLKLTAKRNLFGVMHYLMAEADDILALKSICNVCCAVDTATRTKSFDSNTPSVKTGGIERYYAVCPTCDGGNNEENFLKETLQEEKI